MISSANTGVISVSCTDLTYPGLHIHMDPPANILNSPTKPQIKQPHIQQSPKIGAKLRQHFQGFYAGQSKSSDQNLSATTPTSPSIKAKISKSFNDWTSSERLKLWRSKLPKGKKPSSSQQLTEVDGVVPILPLPNFPPTPLLSTAGTSADRTSLQPGKSQRLTTAAVENTYDSANGSFLPAELSVVGCGEKTIERNPLDTSFSQDSLKSEFVRYSNGSASDVELSRFRSQPHFASLKHPRTGSTQMSYRTEPSESGSFGYPDSCYSELRQINQRSNEKRNSLASFYQQELAKKVFLQQQLKPNGYKTSKSYGNLYNDDKIYEEIDFAPDINSSLVSNIPPPVKIAPLSGIRPETVRK